MCMSSRLSQLDGVSGFPALHSPVPGQCLGHTAKVDGLSPKETPEGVGKEQKGSLWQMPCFALMPHWCPQGPVGLTMCVGGLPVSPMRSTARKLFPCKGSLSSSNGFKENALVWC